MKLFLIISILILYLILIACLFQLFWLLFIAIGMAFIGAPIWAIWEYRFNPDQPTHSWMDF